MLNKFSDKLLAVSIAAAMAVLQPQFVIALTNRQINQIAEDITVRIDGPNSGTGVIVKKEGTNPICYTVLTNWHVVKKPGDYVLEIRDRRYTVRSSQVRQLRGADLAVLSFQSEDNDYRKANPGDSTQIRRNDKVYVSGWADGDSIFPRRRLLVVEGTIMDVLPNPVFEGYTLRYSNPIQPGMSGGPVLDDQGRLIGINGSGRYGASGFLGIPINTFLVWDGRFGNIPSPGSCRSARSTTPPRRELTGFPKQECGGFNPPGLQTWYPVFVDYSDRRLRQIQARFCHDAGRNDTRDPNRSYIQVASFRDRSVAEEFARIMRTEFGSGEVGQAYNR